MLIHDFVGIFAFGFLSRRAQAEQNTGAAKNSSHGPRSALLPELHKSFRYNTTSSALSTQQLPPNLATEDDSASSTRSQTRTENADDSASDKTAASTAPSEVSNGDEELDEELRRQAKYVRFAGDDENDYTAGPVRIIEASDGVKADCGAMLLNLDPSSKIKTAIAAERDLGRTNLRTQAQIQECLAFEQVLADKISGHEYGILRAEGQFEDPDCEDEEEKRAELQALHDELEKLEALQQETMAERECIQAQLNLKVQNYLIIQAEVTQYIEEAFVEAELIELPEGPEDNEIKERDVDEEYRKYCERMEPQADDFIDNNVDYNLHSFDQRFQPIPLSAEEQAQKGLYTAYEIARCSLRDAQNQFDRKDAVRESERQLNDWKLHQYQGAEGESDEAFDVRWVQKNRDITRELIDAEEAFATARKAAVAGGLEIKDADQCSDFGDDDGVYPPSLDEQLIAYAPREKVEAWRAAISLSASGVENVESDVVGDDWEADEVEIGDSYSTVAEPENKRKIRKWQTACASGRMAPMA